MKNETLNLLAMALTFAIYGSAVAAILFFFEGLTKLPRPGRKKVAIATLSWAIGIGILVGVLASLVGPNGGAYAGVVAVVAASIDIRRRIKLEHQSLGR